MSSHQTTQTLPENVKRQLVLDQLEKDPSRQQGPALIKEGIRMTTGIDLTRDYVESEMRVHDPDGFELRDPTSRQIKRGTLVNIGIHEEWSGDGHDKLKEIGFPVYGIRDVWSGKWLGLWVLPNNRMKEAVAYLWLSVIEEYGGLPIQTTTDCGTETVVIYGLVVALREAFTTLSPEEIPAHRFLKSVYNITIERGWLRFKLQFGDNVKEFWARGELDGVYNPNNQKHQLLVQWLWPKLIQQELDQQRARFNAHKTRYDRNKYNPSGVSPNIAFSLYQDHGGHDCLQKLSAEQLKIIRDLKELIGGEKLIRFVTPPFSERCEEAFSSLEVTELTFENVWAIFEELLPIVFEEEM